MAVSYDKITASAVATLVYLLAGTVDNWLKLLLCLYFFFPRGCLNQIWLVQNSAENLRAAGNAATRWSQQKSECRSCQTRVKTDENDENFNWPKCICSVSCLGEYRRRFARFLCTSTLCRQRCTREKEETCGAVVVEWCWNRGSMELFHVLQFAAILGDFNNS